MQGPPFDPQDPDGGGERLRGWGPSGGLRKARTLVEIADGGIEKAERVTTPPPRGSAGG